MNKIRRKALQEIRDQIEGLKEQLESIQCDEEEYRDNMPENLQGSEKYEKAEDAVSQPVCRILHRQRRLTIRLTYRANGEKGTAAMNDWKPLHLTNSHPNPEELVALRLIPCNGKATLYKRTRYDIGVFELDPNTGRKLWWHGTHGCEDPVRLKKHYEIWWCPVPDER